MSKQTYRLVHSTARKNAQNAINSAPDGYICTIEEPKKSRSQEKKYHAMIADIARSVLIYERFWTEADMKRLLVDQFARDMHNAGSPLEQMDGQTRIVPSLDKTGVVQLGVQTRDFTKAEGIAFVDWLYAFGAENEVAWTEPDQGYEQIRGGSSVSP